MHAQAETFKSSSTLVPERRRSEQGYALVALLAVMSIMALMLVSAAPSIKQQMQRSLEEEAIWRGEQVAEAIRLFVRGTGRLPTSMDELREGYTRGTKRIQVLRPVAARDPLSSTNDGEWRLIKKTDPAFLDFQRAVMAYAGRPVNTTDQTFVGVAGPLPQITNVLDIGESEAAPGGEDSSANSSGQFIGVASRSRHDSIITYYGIERHDKWIFTPYFR